MPNEEACAHPKIRRNDVGGDDGDVAPRWRIPVKQITGGGQNSGIAIIPKEKEILIASALKNRVLTFYFPEMFE
jgi:hypothetical protein